MAALRDRPLMRDALLAGGVIAASAVAALIALDRGPGARPHFGFAISTPEHLTAPSPRRDREHPNRSSQPMCVMLLLPRTLYLNRSDSGHLHRKRDRVTQL